MSPNERPFPACPLGALLEPFEGLGDLAGVVGFVVVGTDSDPAGLDQQVLAHRVQPLPRLVGPVAEPGEPCRLHIVAETGVHAL